MLEILDAITRRRRFLASLHEAERRAEEAQVVVDSARERAVRAQHTFHQARGKNAVPNGDQPDALDRELINAIESYQLVRRSLELPLLELREIWERNIEATRHISSIRNVNRAVAIGAARAIFFNQLTIAEAGLTVAGPILRSKLTQQLIRKAARRSANPEGALLRYQQNNAVFIAAVERLNMQLNPDLAFDRRGLQGGLSGDIADKVETTPLLSGPLVATLRRYQTFGARYLIVQERTLLGDDMGLGKTVQVLAAMCHLHALGSRHFFVVAPNSVLINWQREIQKHTDLRAIIVHGSDRDASILEWQALGGVAITTYGTVSKVLDRIESIDFLAVDEAHYAKNPEALRTKAIATLTERSQYVTLMTGTALENRLGELHSLVSLAHPALGWQMEQTLRTHEGFIDPDLVSSLIAPAYLRRTQSDVLTELPERVHVDEWVELSDTDKVAYRDSKADLMSRRVTACVGNGSKTSAKYKRLQELVEEHTTAGRKVVVFSYFRQVITDVCALTGGSPSITGDTSSTERQRIIDDFSNDSTAMVMVSQIDAGGIGINLQAAQVVILMEPQFKPSTEWQAIARVHRMGQSRTVLVHRLLARNTIEERLVQLILEKTATFMAYANDSEVRDASVMAIDTRDGDFEAELKRLLDEDPGL